MTTEIERLSALQAKARLDAATPPALLDVREPWERDLVKIEGAIAIPLGSLNTAFGSLDRERPLIIYCHHGMRSFNACRFLAAQGFGQLANLEGGIDAWSCDVDGALPRY